MNHRTSAVLYSSRPVMLASRLDRICGGKNSPIVRDGSLKWNNQFCEIRILPGEHTGATVTVQVRDLAAAINALALNNGTLNSQESTMSMITIAIQETDYQFTLQEAA